MLRRRKRLRPRRKGKEGTSTYGDEWRSIVEWVRRRDRYTCVVCGGEFHDAHHIVHKGAGGTHEGWNLIGLCRPCHRTAESVGGMRAILLRAMTKRHGYVYDTSHFALTGKVLYLSGGPEVFSDL